MSLEPGLVRVVFHPARVTPARIKAAIADLGYTAEEKLAGPATGSASASGSAAPWWSWGS